ncbi:uncharacterized protein F4812DRAFT_89202 [Daldinia caldariorum]|uniref:uncharacterized protein n=1 Tax=Daldinia caldariorum TaxID=326644 RepID=UPI0020087AA8|nr:uncharacterized protein F4812DRAFT_89202 [Daldinia caldariorum]KAI1465933.1 hypothetical protein F4812DRAFT_89202 [Daldinia caldariorum]
MQTTQVSNGLSPVSEMTPESSPGPSPKRQCFQNSPAYSTIEAAALGGLAARACEKCRASKRKCDKKLPFCDRCKRLNAKCHYIHDISNNLVSQGAQLVIYQPHSLVHDVLLRGPEPLEGITPPQILSLISPPSSSSAPAPVDWRAVAAAYFQCIHSWYAVVHPTLFEQRAASLAGLIDGGGGASTDSPEHAGNPDVNIPPFSNSNSNSSNPSSSLVSNSHCHSNSSATTTTTTTTTDRHAKTTALLIVAMYLLTRMRVTDAGEQPLFDATYRAAKRLLSSQLLACAGDPAPEIELVQCGALVALYEYGHGDAVTAYRTLSQAVVTARVLGIKPGQLAEGGGGEDVVMTSVEEEQSGCLWWGMFILEQFIHQDEEARDFPFLLESPTRNTLLPETPPTTPPPSSTGGGLNGTTTGAGAGAGAGFPLSPASTRHLSTNIIIGTEKFGGFQLSAKTACLFHRALHIDKERDGRPGKMPLVSTYADLDREIRDSTLTLLNDTLDWEAMLDCFAMLVSALFTLYMPYLAILENSRHLGASSPASLLASSQEVSTALAALRFACKMSTDISCKLNANFGSAPRSPVYLCAPAGATCYLVIQAYAAIRRIFPEEMAECEKDIEEKFESLRLFSFRWGIAEKMMSRLEEKLNIDRNVYLQNSQLMPPPQAICFDFTRR